MAESNELALAKTVYADLCETLEKRGLVFEKHDDALVITFSSVGEDFPIDFVLAVEAEPQLLRVYSRLPFTVPEDKRMDLAIATCVASYGLIDGNFDYDISKGIIRFLLTASFRESTIGSGLFDYLIGVSFFTIDKYNDKFFALSKGLMSVNDFIAQE